MQSVLHIAFRDTFPDTEIKTAALPMAEMKGQDMQIKPAPFDRD